MIWQTKKLSEITDFISRGISPQYTSGKGILILNQKCVRNHEINIQEAKRHGFSKKFSNDKLLQLGDVLVNSTGVGTLGRVAQVKDINEPMLVDSHVTIVRPNKDIFNLNYFGWVMIFIESLIQEMGTGSSGQIELSRESLRQMEITYPESIEIQNEIVAKLDKKFEVLREAKQLREEAIKDTEKILSQTLREIFEGGKNKGWEEREIKDICKDLFAGGDVPRSNFSKIKTDKYSIPIYANGFKNKGLYGFTDIEKVKEPSVTISGRGTIGYSEIRRETFFPIVRLIVLIPNTDLIDLDFLYYTTKSFEFSNSGTSIPQLTIPMVKNLKILIPNLLEQKQIVNRLDKLSKQLRELRELQESQLEDLNKLEKAYLREAFNGELI